MGEAIFVGGGGEGYGTPQQLLLRLGNRHGLIAGATGTGKTVTLQVLAEAFSREGVPIVLADVKGDLAGMAVAGNPAGKLAPAFAKRAATIGMKSLDYAASPVTFWDVFGQQGHPVRATVTEMGPLLLARLMQLSDVQEGVLNIAFRLADEEALPLLDLKDLQALLVFIGQNAADIGLRYGNVDKSSVGAIQRALLVLENQGATAFFGEPALDLMDLMRVDPDGRGRVNILAADRLMQSPQLYATVLLWLLSELFEQLPEVGDPDRPKLVFFFDEAHLLFDDAPKALVAKVEQVARLIRSKGVGVYFCTQNPADVPDDILGQLGNRVQHALRAFTPKDQQDLKRAAQTYRPNPRFAVEDAIREVGIGEAVTSFLQAKGEPGMVERTLIRPPASQIGAIDPGTRAAVMAASPVRGKYDTPLDRESAFEKLQARAGAASEAAAAVATGAESFNSARRYTGGTVGAGRPVAAAAPQAKPAAARRSDSLGEAFAKSFVRQLGSAASREIIRGVMGGLFRAR